jgi:hypothetical protein
MSMPEAPEPPELSSNHRDTLAQVLRHPVSHNVEWRAALSLLEQVATVTERHDGKFEVSAAGQTVVLRRPHGKDLDAEQVVDLRHLLIQAGYGPDATGKES